MGTEDENAESEAGLHNAEAELDRSRRFDVALGHPDPHRGKGQGQQHDEPGIERTELCCRERYAEGLAVDDPIRVESHRAG